MTNKLNGLTLDLESTNKDKLKTLFPECFTEGTREIVGKSCTAVCSGGGAH